MRYQLLDMRSHCGDFLQRQRVVSKDILHATRHKREELVVISKRWCLPGMRACREFQLREAVTALSLPDGHAQLRT